MIKCNHEAQNLTGTKDGVFCRACKRMFANFAELEADRAKQEKPEKPAKAKPKGGEKNAENP